MAVLSTEGHYSVLEIWRVTVVAWPLCHWGQVKNSDESSNAMTFFWRWSPQSDDSPGGVQKRSELKTTDEYYYLLSIPIQIE